MFPAFHDYNNAPVNILQESWSSRSGTRPLRARPQAWPSSRSLEPFSQRPAVLVSCTCIPQHRMQHGLLKNPDRFTPRRFHLSQGTEDQNYNSRHTREKRPQQTPQVLTSEPGGDWRRSDVRPDAAPAWLTSGPRLAWPRLHAALRGSSELQLLGSPLHQRITSSRTVATSPYPDEPVISDLKKVNQKERETKAADA